MLVEMFRQRLDGDLLERNINSEQEARGCFQSSFKYIKYYNCPFLCTKPP